MRADPGSPYRDPRRIIWFRWDKLVAERELERSREARARLSSVISKEVEHVLVEMIRERDLDLDGRTIDLLVDELEARSVRLASALDVEQVLTTDQGADWRLHRVRRVAEQCLDVLEATSQ